MIMITEIDNDDAYASPKDPFGMDYKVRENVKLAWRDQDTNKYNTSDRDDHRTNLIQNKQVTNSNERNENVDNAITSVAYVKTGSSGAEHETWYVDSGATQHMSSQRDLFEGYEEITTSPVHLADGHTIPVKGKGTINIMVKIRNELKEN